MSKNEDVCECMYARLNVDVEHSKTLSQCFTIYVLLCIHVKGTQWDTTLKNAFNQAFTGGKVFVSNENVLEFR